jgi:glycerate 2-kinase
MGSSSTPTDSENAARDDLRKIFSAAIAAVEPAQLIARALAGITAGSESVPALIESSSRVILLAVGKASAAMATEIERHLGRKLADALAIVPNSVTDTRYARASASRIRFVAGAHPLPDQSSLEAARAASDLVAGTSKDDLVIVALSGGASAMCTMPAASIPLGDKIAINHALLRSGANIRELNIVRKHLSALKGGRLVGLCNGARILGLILSDVPGNELATIGSGLAAPDNSTFGDAVAVLKRRAIWGRAPESVRAYLERAIAGEIPETLKADDPAVARITNVIVGDNQIALDAAERAAAALGYVSERWKELRGEANDLGRILGEYLCSIPGERVCVVAGGEPAVTVRGNGRGGRAQQSALAMSLELATRAPSARVAAVFAGTDGIDGPTDAAGAFATPSAVARAEKAGLSAQIALDRNDAYNLFKATGDLFVTGPTGTNVSDIFVGLVNY